MSATKFKSATQSFRCASLIKEGVIIKGGETYRVLGEPVFSTSEYRKEIENRPTTTGTAENFAVCAIREHDQAAYVIRATNVANVNSLSKNAFRSFEPVMLYDKGTTLVVYDQQSIEPVSDYAAIAKAALADLNEVVHSVL